MKLCRLPSLVFAAPRATPRRHETGTGATARGLRGCLTCVAIACFASLAASAQVSDTVILKGSPSDYTILSDVKDPQERDLFTQLYKTSDPLARHQLAERFLAAFPQSWLLPQVYDLAAKASLDLGNVPQALDEGRFSLRLLPENPTLLVLMANAEAQARQFEQAIGHARDALEFLDRFAQPGAYSEKQWALIKPQLASSAWFALARALFAEALLQPAPPADLLASSRDALNHAAANNPDDPEVFYLRALVETKSNDKSNALRDLAFVALSSHPLRVQAAAAFRRLSDQDPARQPKPAIDKSLRGDSADSKPTSAIRAGYAGSQTCKSCHAREYETWRQSGMAKMLRPFKPENVMGDFSSGRTFKDESGNVVVRMGIDSRPYFDVLAANGSWPRFRVDYTIGSKWQQAYATQLPDGRLQVIPIQYNALQKSWVNYWKIIDPPGSKRDDTSAFPALSSATNYQENCAICHTSQLRAAAEEAASPMEHAAFREPGIDCEMCHGPGAHHIQRIQSGHLAKDDLLEPPVDFRRITNRDGVRVCAQCHRQSAVREIGDAKELNYSSSTGDYVARSWSRPYDAFSRRAFYKDGRFRETTFIVEAFTRSACFRKGSAQCASCHSPHVADIAANPTAVKFRTNSDQLCLGCHNQFEGRVAAHTHHPVDSEASRCVNCHMPRIVNALLFQARSHQIEIPRADLTERFGQNDSPNACLLCHSEKDAAWAALQLKQWPN